MTHICVSKLTIIGSDNGLSPGWRQAIIWTNAGILLIRTLGTNFSEILSEIHAFWFKKMHLKMSSAIWHPFCLGLNVLMLIWDVWLEFKVWPRLYHSLIVAYWCISQQKSGPTLAQDGTKPSTHWGRDKMADIFQTTIYMHFLEWRCMNFD